MKFMRYIAACTALALALCLTACSNETESVPETTNPAVTDSVVEETTETETSTESPETTAAETKAPTETETIEETQAPSESETAEETQTSAAYTTMTAKDPENELSYIKYPKLESGEHADAINALIKAKADEMLASIHDEDLDIPDVEWTCNIYADYEITRDDEKYLSILWTGDWFVSYAPHPNQFAQGLIIDKSTMTEVKLNDLYTVDEAFVQKVQAQVDAQLHSVLAEKFDVSTDDVKEITSDMTIEGFVQNGTQFDCIIPVCLAENGVIFSVYVPHYVGDHCEIVIPYEEFA